MAKHNRAAFAPDDVEDAKRGHPDFDLREYAERRGLEFLDHGTPAGFGAALPREEELQSNVVRGTLPGGGYGVLAHEGLEIGYSTDSLDWGGTFYGERVRAKGSLNPFGDPPTPLVRVPCTVAAMRVPETAGTHPYIRIDTRRSSPPFSFTNRTKLDQLLGEKGWSMWCEPKPDPGTVERLVADPSQGSCARIPTTACSRSSSGGGRWSCAATASASAGRRRAGAGREPRRRAPARGVRDPGGAAGFRQPASAAPE